LILKEVQHNRPGASEFVVRVRDGCGADLVLKQTAPGRKAREIAVLRAWSGTGVTPRFVAELEPGLYLAEWIDGRVLADVPLDEPVPAAAIGRVLHQLHASRVPDDLHSTRDEVQPDRPTHWVNLSEAMRALGGQIARSLTDRHPPDDVTLHGDLVPANIVLGVDGPRLIDPVGRSGLPAWDVAQLVASAEGRGRRHLLGDVLTGYGDAPSLLPEMLAWMVLFYLDKNLARADSPFTANLRLLAETLVALQDPHAFMNRCLL